jgi:hypothetical protein
VVRSCRRTCSMGPRVTMIRARAVLAEWKPKARLMMSGTRLFESFVAGIGEAESDGGEDP